MGFGDKIRQARHQKGLLQTDITKVLGYETDSYVSDVERGKFIPQPDKLRKIAKLLNISISDIEDFILEDKLEKLGMDDPAFTMMFKEIPKMTREEKESLIRAYESVLRARQAKRKK